MVDYQDRFEEIRPKLTAKNLGLSEEFFLSSFVSGLKDEIRHPVRVFKSTSIHHAIELARLQEASLELKKLKPWSNKFNHTVNTHTNPPKVEAQNGEVAYRLMVPARSQIHPVFHVSQLKKKVGALVTTSLTLSQTSSNRQLLAYPVDVLEHKLIKRNNKAAVQFLVQWSNVNPKDATWEDALVLASQFLDFELARNLRKELMWNDWALVLHWSSGAAPAPPYWTCCAGEGALDVRLSRGVDSSILFVSAILQFGPRIPLTL
ncbi:hypothetical protein Dsin_002794 [Dipteronia sinensis]|uniref:Tf2-1-like SH3-like domain-containing protein n=1 Tax=Dipteronia sinensis TaxID=43782 RepID=A0AAE0B7S4_9ROSI|nr:hypothetical protein Dsin_002794 [Dipteronia sinensis]